MKKLILKEHLLTISMLLGAAAAIIFAGFTAFAEDCENLPERLFRLHILANSDSDEDQSLKYALRDYLLAEFTELFDSCETADDAREAAKESLAEIAASAQSFVRESGCGYTVTASVEKIYFTTRQYGSVTVPAGDYDSLRILIGEGKGKNWWCVMFPPLCLPAAEGTIELSENETGFLFNAKLKLGKNKLLLTKAQSLKIEESKNVEVRFAVYEWLRKYWE